MPLVTSASAPSHTVHSSRGRVLLTRVQAQPTPVHGGCGPYVDGRLEKLQATSPRAERVSGNRVDATSLSSPGSARAAEGFVGELDALWRGESLEAEPQHPLPCLVSWGPSSPGRSQPLS